MSNNVNLYFTEDRVTKIDLSTVNQQLTVQTEGVSGGYLKTFAKLEKQAKDKNRQEGTDS